MSMNRRHGLPQCGVACISVLGAVVTLSVVYAGASPKSSASDDLSIDAAGSNEAVALFNEKVAPVLAESCYDCHGDRRKGGFDLSTREALLIGGDEGPAIVPGNAKESLLYQLITHERDPVMPRRADKLSDEAIAAIAEWIDAGAPYPREITPAILDKALDDAAPVDAVEEEPEEAAEPDPDEHWSFSAPECPELPAVTNASWARNAIDTFVLARLESEGVEPSPEADRHTLIRRLSLDLLGLLPTPEEVDAFVNDTSPDAYEKLVDRMLASPHFGERWARHWLDLARYADSDGFEKDSPRPYAWRYRNWVIEAINRDLPFDQFTVEQLAGDLLPEPTIEQRVATGFHRNTLTNREGGTDPEQFRVEAVVDRVNTTGSVWLGLTVACAQCHTHKYDPITQREYYSLFAFFNQADEKNIPAPLADQLPRYRREKEAFDKVHDQLKATLATYDEHELPLAMETWEEGLRLPDPYWAPLEASFATSAEGATVTPQADGSLLVTGQAVDTDRTVVAFHTDSPKISALRLEVLPHESLGSNGPGRAPNGNFVLSELKMQVAPSSNPVELKPVTLTNASASVEQGDFPAASAIDGKPKTGWAIGGAKGRRNEAVFETQGKVGFEGGTLIVLTLDQNHGGEHTLGRFRVAVTSAARPIRATGIPDDVAEVLLTAADQRDEAQHKRLLAYYRGIDSGHAKLKRALDEHAANSPDTRAIKAQAMVRTSQPRTTHVHIRGDFLREGAEVPPSVPAVLPPLAPRNGKADRLDLARWIVAEENPLSARVAANRIWMHLFGTGIVETPEDFGTRGELPSHPELLDWLATEYRRQGWSRKAMIKLIVTSATYRQVSHTREELVDRDPKNRWLARQNRFRLSAEVIRDLSLDASGLLHSEIGGPSVHPPQPAGIAELTYAGSARWKVSPAPDRYRRGLYTWFQRTSPYPMLMTFDAPDSNVSCTRRRRSNTPLQSLTLLNDPVFVECAQHLGKRVSENIEGDVAARIRRAWVRCTSRPPTEAEVERLVHLYREMRDAYRQEQEAARALLGDLPVAKDRMVETAAWVAVGRVLLNLDEFMTRG